MTKRLSHSDDWYEAIHTVKSLPGKRFLVTISNDNNEEEPMFFVRIWDITGYPIKCFDDFQADSVRAIGAKQFKHHGDPAPDWDDVLDIGDYEYIEMGKIRKGKSGFSRGYATMEDAKDGLKLYLKEM